MNRVALALVWIVSLSGARLVGAADQAVGTIVAPRPADAWLVDGKRALDGAAAYAGNEVKLASVPPAVRERASIAIVYSDRRNPDVCHGAERCANGFVIAQGGPIDPRVGPLAEAGRLVHTGVLPEFAAGRGIAAEAVADGVIARDGNRLAIGPLLSAVEPGAYRAAIAPVGGARLTVPVAVGGGPAPVVELPAASDGLYTLVLRSADGSDVLSPEAAFLALGPPRFAAAKSVYDGAVALTRSWSDTPENGRLATVFLRRVLAALAEVR